jgi:hypothetical protein
MKVTFDRKEHHVRMLEKDCLKSSSGTLQIDDDFFAFFCLRDAGGGF